MPTSPARSASKASAAAPVTLVAAHRGGAYGWPENSLGAFRNAVALGVDLLEADLHLTADGEVVVLHDPTLDRTTTGRGAAARTTRAALGSLRLKRRDGIVTDEPVPTLAELLDLVAPSGVGVLLEIKVGRRRRSYPGVEEKVLRQLRARDLVGRAVVMAFEVGTLARVRRLEPALRTALLVGGAWRARRSAVAATRRAEAVGATHLGLHHRLLTPRAVLAARAAHLRLAAWTVNGEGDLRRVIGLGVDVVITDRPDLALPMTGR